MKNLKNFALLTASVNAQLFTVPNIQSAYLTHTSSNTQNADTSLHGCNCKFLSDETFKPGPVIDGEADWVCRGWRIARTCLLKQNTICPAQANPVYEFDGNCNTITGTDEVCHRALCNLDYHFAEELDNAVIDADWSAQQVYTDVDNPGQCALLGNRTSTLDRCCVSSTGVYTYLQQYHFYDFESKCTLPNNDSTETLIQSRNTIYVEDPERGWNGNFPHKLASFEKDGIIFHCGGNYIQSFFANNGTVVDTYLNENRQSGASHCNAITPFEYQGSPYFASAHMANNKGAIYIYKLDDADHTYPVKKFLPIEEDRTSSVYNVKVHGDKMVACGSKECYYADIAILLSQSFNGNGLGLEQYSNRVFTRESDNANIEDAEFDDTFVWIWENKKLRKFRLDNGEKVFDSLEAERDNTNPDSDYWKQINDGGSFLRLYDGKLFLFCGVRYHSYGPRADRPYINSNRIRMTQQPADYARGFIMILDSDNSVSGYYRHKYPITTFQISNGLFMFTETHQKYIDPLIEPDGTAQRESGSLLIFDIEEFMTSASSFQFAQPQDHYDTSPFQVHEIDENIGGRARAIEISGDSVFVLGHYSYYGDEIRRFTFSNP
jgi:hypothetical protein